MRTTIARTTGRSPVLRLRGQRAGDPHYAPAPPSWRGVVRRVKLATLIMSKEIRQVLSENCCMWYGNRVENWLNSGRLTGKNDFFDGKLDRSMPP